MDLKQILRILARHLRLYTRCENGATAIEFALVSFPFIFMIIGIIEMSLMFTAQSVLDRATSNAARLVRTGQLQQLSGAAQQTAFEDAVCDYAGFLMDCSQIQYLVQDIEDFAEANTFAAPEFDEDGNMVVTGFSLGGSSDVVFMRVVYRYPIVTPIMAQFLGNSEGNKRVLMSTNVLKAEPYEFGT